MTAATMATTGPAMARTSRTVVVRKQKRTEPPQQGVRSTTYMVTKYESNKAWRKRNPLAWQRSKKRNYAGTRGNNRNHHEEWTLREMNMIIAPDRPTDRELSAILGRSVQAIQVKRTKMK